MFRFSYRFMTTFLVASLTSVPMTQAAGSDYEFTLEQSAYPVGDDVNLDVYLSDTRTQSAVDNAIIFAIRMDMEPDGMETMTSPIVSVPMTEPGHYRFSTDLTMAGNWRFSIAAKVQGELETVQAQFVVRAEP